MKGVDGALLNEREEGERNYCYSNVLDRLVSCPWEAVDHSSTSG